MDAGAAQGVAVLATRSMLTAYQNRRKVYEREGTVTGLEDEGCLGRIPPMHEVARSRSVVRFCWGVRRCGGCPFGSGDVFVHRC
jgi:hypothetical protein